MTYQLHHGDCLNILPMMDRESIDAFVTDPPYGLGFMGKDWDHGVPGEHFWREAYRVAKPGAHLLAFGGTRTFHRLAVAIEDAGWEIRDTVMWVYGQGFPKSHDVSKAIDREAGAEREVIGIGAAQCEYIERGEPCHGHNDLNGRYGETVHSALTQPATPAAAQWQGYGTALKPAWEPIIVARKPLQGTVADNVQRYGTGAINVEACRIGVDGGTMKGNPPKLASNGIYGNGINGACDIIDINAGRWPANLIHDGSAEVLAGFPNVHGAGYAKQAGGHNRIANRSIFDNSKGGIGQDDYGGARHGDTGSAALFFYCAKASKQDRDEGLEGFDTHIINITEGHGRGPINTSKGDGTGIRENRPRSNVHPTVKPTALMRYLCRLVTPPQGVILDPFMGSGSTGKAAILEGFNFIGIDTNIEYVEIAARRIEFACGKMGIVIDQPMLIESRREAVDRPRQLVLI